MLKIFILFYFIVVCAVNAAPVNKDDDDDDGSFDIYIPDDSQNYQYQYELEDGQKQEQSGYFKFVDADRPMVLVVEGFYSFIAPDGKTYRVEYIADENGYRATIKDQEGITTGIEGPDDRPPPVTFSNQLLSLVG